MTNGIVVDTNVLISAMLAKPSQPTPPMQVLAFILENSQLFFSRETFFELETIAARKKFDRYGPYAERRQFVELLSEASKFVMPAEGIELCRDPKDNMILATALGGNAVAIVTGDQDLLTLKTVKDVPILTPAAYLETVNAPSQPSSS